MTKKPSKMNKSANSDVSIVYEHKNIQGVNIL